MQYHQLTLRILGAAHVAVVIVLLPVATFFGMISLVVVVPVVVWLAVLGARLWRPSAKLRKALRITHLMLAPFAVLLVYYGLYALLAAKRSAEAGGGLLGSFGIIPVAIGLLVGFLSLASLVVSFSTAPWKPAESPGADKMQGQGEGV